MSHYLLTLTRAPGLGNATLKKLFHRFGDAAAIFKTPRAELAGIPRVTGPALAFLTDEELSASAAILDGWEDEGYNVIFWGEDNYPESLTRLNDPPMFFFHVGKLDALQKPSVAVVGTRDPSSSAAERAREIGRELAIAGLVVTSGFAEGIDRMAHVGALEGGGETVAVLGSGLKSIHPRGNRDLVPKIKDAGCFITEFYPSTPAKGRTLMARNRIVIALSKAVIVVEAGLKSGSLDAARRAAALGIPIRVIPGSPGADQLLREGAEQYRGTDGVAVTGSNEPQQLSLLD